MMKQSERRMNGHPLSESLALRLRRDILQGRLQPGEKLSEQKLCQEHGLSRTPVREALHQLEGEGLIQNVPNRGAFVRGLTEQDISDLYEMRKLNEVLAVRWAIERITEEELERLAEAYEFMEFYTLRKDSEKMLHRNMEFHDQIYRAAHNRILYQNLNLQQSYLFQMKTATSYLDQSLDAVLKEHERIYQAFCIKDPDEGAKAMKTHLENAKKRADSSS